MPRGEKTKRRRKSQGPQRRAWIGTINNPEEDSVLSRLAREPVLPDGVSYIAFQLEKGEKGTPHYQVYCECSKARFVSWFQKHIAPGHWEPRNGSAVQASLYCTKDDTRIEGPWTIGTISKGAGSRTDLVDFKDAIRSGKRKRDLWESHTVQMAKYRHMYDDLRRCHRPERSVELTVALLVGKTGTGKTYTVWNQWKADGYWGLPVSGGRMWFDGYDGERNVLFDDFAGKMSKVGLSMLLRILHEYPIQVEVKGSFVWWMPDNIAITSNFHPREWYDWTGREEQYRALCRRIHQVSIFEEDEEIQHLFEDDELEEYFSRREFDEAKCYCCNNNKKYKEFLDQQ